VISRLLPDILRVVLAHQPSSRRRIPDRLHALALHRNSAEKWFAGFSYELFGRYRNVCASPALHPHPGSRGAPLASPHQFVYSEDANGDFSPVGSSQPSGSQQAI
jgi:hypothetical protein